MKPVTVLFAGAMLASAVFASVNDSGAEERFRMKFGRNTPAEEARQKAAKQARPKNMMNCAEQGCCRRMHDETARFWNACGRRQ